MQQKKGKKGRSDGGFARVTNDMMKTEAFRSLSASALRVLLWSIYRNYKTATNQAKGETCKPHFTFTNSEALNELGMPSPTFSRAKEELAEKGFLEWKTRGGLRGTNGVMSEYFLSADYKEWKAPRTASRDMSQVRAAKKSKVSSLNRYQISCLNRSG